MSMNFRRMLRRELEAWQREGLIGPRGAARLKERYRLDGIEKEAQATLLNTIFLIGAVLIGCGVVAFVAAHWEEISRTVKVALLSLAMVASHGGGYWLRRVRARSRPRLGHALILLGTLIFGANIALFAQIFHVSGDIYEAWFAWAAGAAVMAFCAGSVPNAVTALAASFVGYGCWVDRYESALLAYPVVAAAVLLPLCYLKRSVVLFFLTVTALAAALITNGVVLSGEAAWRAALLFAVTPAALWCYGAFHHRGGRWPIFGALARGLGALGMGGFLFVLSFHEAAGGCGYASPSFGPAGAGYLWVSLMPPAAALVLALIAAVRGPGSLKTWLVPALLGAAACGALFLPDPEVLGTAAFNVLAAGLAAFGIAAGLRRYDRLPYWSGLGLTVILVAARFFEYESHLLIKSAGFIAAGVILILAGVAFENRMRGREAPAAAPGPGKEPGRNAGKETIDD